MTGRAATGLALVVAVGCTATSARNDRSVLTYSEGVSNPVVLRTAGRPGVTYVLRLTPDVDVHGTVRTLTAEMVCQACEDQGNQLYDGRPLHGLQPFMFGAQDTDHFTRRRRIALDRAKLSVEFRGLDFRFCRPAEPASGFCSASVAVSISDSRP